MGIGNDLFMRHYFRNGLNKPPATMKAAIAAGTWNLMPPEASRFHRIGPNGKFNTKWIDDSGHCEAVYDRDGQLVTDIVNGGTYNFGPPDNWRDHFVLDMLPYFLWGNGPIVINGTDF